MTEKLYLALDLGTSFLKAGVYTRAGRCLGSYSEPVRDERPGPGIFIQRGDMLYDAILRCIRGITGRLPDPGAIAAIAFTGQMAGCIGVDEHWGDVTGWTCSLDSRYLPFADSQRARLGEEMFTIGGTVAPVLCAKYEWFRESFPEAHKRIAKYLLLNGYMIGRLSGIPIHQARIDHSLIAWTGLSDIRARSWSETICGKLGIPTRLLPEIVDCSAVGGFLEEGIAKSLSLTPGIPLVLGAGDKVSGCVGAAVLGEGERIFEASSYGAISSFVREVRQDRVKRNYDVIGGIDRSGYYAHKYIQGSGIVLDWFVDNMVKVGDDSLSGAFRRADALAAAVPPGSQNMLAIGLLSGSAMPFDADMRGMFLGHTLSHGKGHFYRALLESFTYDLALTLRSMDARYPESAGTPIKLIGGGAKSDLWPRILADVCGCPFVTLDREDLALWGAALLAARATGDIRDIREAAKARVRPVQRFDPDPGRHEGYQPYVDLYGEMTLAMKKHYQKLAAL